MKNIAITLITIFLATVIYASEKENNEKEKNAIKKVIIELTDAYRAKDYDKIATLYLQDESLVKARISKNGFGINDGWNAVSDLYKRNFKSNPEPSAGKYEKLNYKIRVYPNSAWSMHDEIIHLPNGNKHKQIITHFFEKHKGKWKVIFMASLNVTSYQNAQN